MLQKRQGESSLPDLVLFGESSREGPVGVIDSGDGFLNVVAPFCGMIVVTDVSVWCRI